MQDRLLTTPPISDEDDIEIAVRDESVRASKGSTSTAFINFTKSMMGAGLLGIPHAFNSSGLVLGIAFYVLIAFLCIYSMMLVIKCKHEAQRRVERPNTIVTYRDVGLFAFGRPGEWVVQISVVVLELAFCAGFVIVIVDNMHTLIPQIHHVWIAVAIAPILILLSWIRWLKNLWFFSLFGAVVYICGVMGGTLYSGIDNPGTKINYDLDSWATLPMFLGTAIYSLEGINCVLPVENSMQNPHHSYAVVSGGVTLYAAMVASYGAFGYVYGYGECILVTDCLPPGPLSVVVKVALCISLLFSHPVVLYPATEILEEAWLQPPKPWNETRRKALRAAQVIFTCILGVVLPDFALFSNLVGSVLLSVIGFLVPSAMYIRIFSPTLRRLHGGKKLRLILVIALNVTVILIGLAFMIFGTISSITAIVENLEGHSKG